MGPSRRVRRPGWVGLWSPVRVLLPLPPACNQIRLNSWLMRVALIGWPSIIRSSLWPTASLVRGIYLAWCPAMSPPFYIVVRLDLRRAAVGRIIRNAHPFERRYNYYNYLTLRSLNYSHHVRLNPVVECRPQAGEAQSSHRH